MDCYGNLPDAGPDNGVFKLVVYLYLCKIEVGFLG